MAASQLSSSQADQAPATTAIAAAAGERTPPTGEAHDVKPTPFDCLDNADIADYMEKQKKYETIFARRLRAKYFSKKSFSGGDIFNQETTVNSETIKSSSWPCTRSFAEPFQNLGDPTRSPSSAAETSATPLKKYKKSC